MVLMSAIGIQNLNGAMQRGLYFIIGQCNAYLKFDLLMQIEPVPPHGNFAVELHEGSLPMSGTVYC